MRTKNEAHTAGPVEPLGFLAAPHIEAKRLVVLKFAPNEAYIDDLLDGRLYMNAAGYHHGLPGEQGDPLKASLAYGMGIYDN